MEHKNLDVWKASMELAVAVYQISGNFPKEEVYGLTSQLKRASVSVAANIAEGAARNSDKEFIHFLYIALGSLAETETLVLLAEQIGYCPNSGDIHSKLTAIKQMLLGLIKHLKSKQSK